MVPGARIQDVIPVLFQCVEPLEDASIDSLESSLETGQHQMHAHTFH